MNSVNSDQCYSAQYLAELGVLLGRAGEEAEAAVAEVDHLLPMQRRRHAHAAQRAGARPLRDARDRRHGPVRARAHLLPGRPARVQRAARLHLLDRLRARTFTRCRCFARDASRPERKNERERERKQEREVALRVPVCMRGVRAMD